MTLSPGTTKRCFTLLASVVLLLSSFCLPLSAATKEIEEIEKLAERAYTYGYPLVLMDVTKWTMVISEDTAANPEGTLLNRFNHARAFVLPSFVDVVNPNADTLYSMAWFDLGATPMMLSLPAMDTEDRYYLMEFLDAWTNVFSSIGSRTTGNGAGRYMIVGPDWSGVVPADVTLLRSPTRMAWLLGRTETSGPEDYAAVNALQDRYILTPVDPAAKPFLDFAADHETFAADQLAAMPAVTFFDKLNALMADNPPAAIDAPLLAEVAGIGVVPGRPFTPDVLSPDVLSAVERGYERARAFMATHTNFETIGVERGIWSMLPDNTGRFEDDYYTRALVASGGLGGNTPDDAIYATAELDESKAPFHGSRHYTLRIEPEGMPVPVNAFWSLTMYNERHGFVDNPLDRYALGDRSGIIPDEDGGLTIYIQSESPGRELESNWLPAPEGPFNLILRFYWPDGSIQAGSWIMPRVRAADEGAGSGSSGCAAGVVGPVVLMFVGAFAISARRHRG